MSDGRRKVRAATAAAVTASLLAATKLTVGLLTGSLAVIAAAMDSLMDVACSGLNAYFLRVAASPPDAEHRFGHGKAEALSGVIQATIIAMGGAWLVGRGVWHLILPVPVTAPEAGVAVSALAFVVSLALVWFLRREARATQSLALHADAFHYVTDIATNTVAGVALLGYRALGWHWLDPLASVLIAIYIIKSAIDIVREASDELLDRGLPHDVEEGVRTMLLELGPEVRGYHAFRSRRAGGTQFVEFDLLVDRHTTFERAHDLTEAAIARIRLSHGQHTQVMVHTDPV